MLPLFEKVWKSKISKIILISLGGILLIVFAFWYLSLFNQKMMNFNGDQLVQTDYTDSTQYKGKYLSESILINVQKDKQNTGEIMVEFNLPNRLYFEYHVFLEKMDDFRGKIRILQENKEIFNGIYDKNQPFYLYNNISEPYLGDMLTAVINGDYYPKDYTPSLTSIARFATGHGVEKRGDFIPLVFFFITLIIYIIDIKFPLFFFQLQNSLHVKDPEPSDFYLVMQKLGWYVVYPLIMIILLFKGIH